MRDRKKDIKDEHGRPESREIKTRSELLRKNSSHIMNPKTELHDLEAWYDALFDNANDAIFLMDQDRFIDCNPKTLEMYRCTKEQIIGQKPYNRFSPRVQPDGQTSKEKALDKIRSALEGKPQFFEWRHLRYDGTPFEAEVSLYRVEIYKHFYLQAFVRDITKQKHTHIQYEMILKTAMDGFGVFSKNGTILEVNDAYCNMIGYSREELLSMNLADVEALESRNTIKKHIENLMSSGSHRFETRHKRKDGKLIDVEVSANIFKLDGHRLFAFFRDITERKKAEDALRESEEMARTLLNATTDAVHLLDEEGIIIDINDAMAEKFGATREELIGTCVFDIFPPEIAKRKKEIVKSVLESNEPIRFEDESHDTWFDSNVHPIATPKGYNRRIAVFAHDITILKKAEKELLRARQDWENIFQAIGQPSFILDPQHKIITANRATVKKTGITLEQLKGIHCSELLHGKKNPPKECPMEKLLYSGYVETVEMEIEAFGGTYLVSCTPVYDNQGQIEKVIHIAIDISDRQQAEEKLREHEEQLKSLASELSLAEERERRRIAAGIHDDIAQRLALTKLELQSMQNTISDSNIISSLKSQCGTIDRIMEDARSLTFELSNPLLYEIGLKTAIESFLIEQIQEKFGIKCKFSSQGPQVNLDEDIRIILYQGVRELLTNIVKHAHANRIEVRIVKSKTQITIIVEDNGIGLNLSKLSSPERNKGGFGLFNIRERLEYLGGNLNIQSKPNKGTCVTMSISLKLKATAQ